MLFIKSLLIARQKETHRDRQTKTESLEKENKTKLKFND